jgi:molecular chaperone GrpE
MAQENNVEQNSEELQKKADEYLNNWKRERADFLNYKKEELERTSALVEYSIEKIILKILPILDNLYLAQKHINDEGLAQVVKQFEDFLKKEGIEPIETTGKPFDANFMEIVAEVDQSSEDFDPAKSGIVIEEIMKGYKIGEKVIRPAKVKIVK